MNERQKIAIIGSGISGLTAGYILSRGHSVTLFEANSYLGGHTHTRNVELDGKVYPVNTGFIVFNDWTYPNFIELMRQLGVPSEASDMSFSVRSEKTGLEYNGTSLNSLFAQRSNIIKPAFLRMITDILRFNREATAALDNGDIDENETLGGYVHKNGYSDYFIDYYIVPMGAAIWSSSVEVILQFPLRFFLRFFNNHGMLSVDDRPQWRVIKGGSRSYIMPITAPYRDSIRLNSPVASVRRDEDRVQITTARGGREDFDHVVFACHSDQALAMLEIPTRQEREILGALPYQSSEVVLHTDTGLLPKRRLAWASWNYHIPGEDRGCPMVSYNMNRLQNFADAPETLLVTLNRSAEIDPQRIIKRYSYSHPVYTREGIGAQARHAEISGRNRTHYCGAYWFNGFHEDGVNSALRVARHFGLSL
jgi:predicted NAD/FAD-binding protein